MLFYATDLFGCIFPLLICSSAKEEKKLAYRASSYIKIRGKSNIRFENADRDR